MINLPTNSAGIIFVKKNLEKLSTNEKQPSGMFY